LGRVIDPNFRKVIVVKKSSIDFWKVIVARKSSVEISVFGAQGGNRGDEVMAVVFILPLVIHDECNDELNGEKFGE
jgi:hypothetical protein